MQSAVQSEVIAAATRALGPNAVPLVDSDFFDWAELLPGALLWDSEGRIPGVDGYVDTWDSDWLAASAAGVFASWAGTADATVKLQVDGDSIEVSLANWNGLASMLYQRSPIFGYASRVLRNALGEIEINNTDTRYIPTSYNV